MTQLEVMPRRFAAPAAGTPRLEMIHQPLYSAVAIDNAAAIPRSTFFFNYAIGNTVSGAGGGARAATLFETNLEVASFLSAPKLFTVHAVRLILSPLNYTAGAPATADGSQGTADENNDQLDDAQLIRFSCALRFFVGPKDYIKAPIFLMPENTGLGGLGVTSISSAADTLQFTNNVAVHFAGKSWTMPTYPVLIANQQNFGAELVNQWTTNPTTNDDKLLWCVLDGVLGREVS